MQKQKNDFATKFLLGFTKNLIENSRRDKIIELNQKEKIAMPREINQISKLKTPKKIMPTQNRIQKNFPQQKIIPQGHNQFLTIPKQKIPPRFQDINPTPTRSGIDLGKLNQIINNPMTQAVECDGQNTFIKVISKDGRKSETQIILTKEEIDKIIETFSQLTKIPKVEGVYKVASGNLILMAVVSEVVGSKFVIKKIAPQQQNIAQRRGFPNPRQMRRR
jgi:hypothetical protein